MNKIYKLPFLENRTYLHSTTLFNFLLQKTSACHSICFKFIKPIYSNAFLLDTNMADAHSIFQYIEKNEQKTIAVHEQPLILPAEREKFNEQAIVNRAVFQEKQIIADITENNFFTDCIALIKALHQVDCKKEDSGRWIFSRADLMQLPKQGTVCISLIKVMPFLSCCSVMQQNQELGKIYFSWVNNI